MRRSRGLFCNARVLHFHPERLAIVLQHARRVEQQYPLHVERFSRFLDGLLDSAA